jgi:hypothetical protein
VKSSGSPIAALVAVAVTTACGMTDVPRSVASEKQHTAAPPAPSPLGSSATASDEGAARSCDFPDVRQAIAQQLFSDQDFHLYICEEQPCTTQDFLNGLTFREVVLRDAPRTLGCIVGPLREALTRIYGVVVLDAPTPHVTLIYLGIDISVDPAFKKQGFKDLVGTERVSPGTWVVHRYVWMKRGYALESTTVQTER